VPLAFSVPPKGYVALQDDGRYLLYNQTSSVIVGPTRDELEDEVVPVTWLLKRDGVLLTETGPPTLDVDFAARTVTRTYSYTDRSKLSVRYSVSDTGAIKVTLRVTPGRRADFRIHMRISGLMDENSGLPVLYNINLASKRFTFTLPDYLGSRSIRWDWSDVTGYMLMQQVTPIDGVYTFEQIFPLGIIRPPNTVTLDPSTVTTIAGQYATAYGNARHLVRDDWGKLIAITTNSNLVFSYCNSPPSGAWTAEDLGATYALTATAAERACSIVYPSGMRIGDGVGTAYLNNTYTRRASKFTVGMAVKLIRVRAKMYKTGNPTGDVYVKLYDNNAGVPGNVLATSNAKDASAFSSTPSRWEEWTITYSLSSATTYWLSVEYTNGDASNYLALRLETGSAGDGAYYSAGAWTNDSYKYAIGPLYDAVTVMWVNGTDDLKVGHIVLQRDGSNNITGRTLSSLLTINSVDDTCRRPSLWLIASCEIAAVWGDNSTAGAKHGRVYSCRIRFGSPPTYVAWDGTASSTTLISSDYGTSHTIHTATITQRVAVGTYNWQMYAFWTILADATLEKKNEGSYGVPVGAWSWGTEAAPTVNLPAAPVTCDYDAANDLILYASAAGASTSIPVGAINSTDTDTDISATGLSNQTRTDLSICVVNGVYYLFYARGSNIYVIQRSGGVWGSEGQLTTTSNESYPSASLITTSRVDFIWTHLVAVGNYDVYYDSISLVPPAVRYYPTWSLRGRGGDHRMRLNFKRRLDLKTVTS